MNNLPTGTVTFLFTDIEGSTKLAQEYPNKWESLRERHHAIMKSAMDAHNGYVFQIIGDAFCVAFHTANDSIHAAIDAQRKLQTENWGETPVKVRMGIHTGKAEIQENGEYHGYLAMSRIQRLMSAGHGGQVLISAATQELLLEDLPKDVSLRDLGERRLKDLIRPEHIYQLVVPGLPVDFPPLKTLEAYRHNLPVQLTSFIGREKEMEEIKQAIFTHRLITLTGVGGTGKTRLSLQVAADMLDQFRDGVWFVELASISDPDIIAQTIVSCLGIPEQPGLAMLQLLLDYVRVKKLLLVLDNCEHLIEASAELVDTLLSSAPSVKIIATSREALGVSGEMTWHVPSLSLPDVKQVPTVEQLSQYEAVQLFIERAMLVQPHFLVTRDNAPAVAQICYRLDGIPLAIELAAARVKGLSVEQIASRLDDRFRLLTGGSRTALPRQRTLQATIDWSYKLLSEEERILLRRLSVFAGGWTLEAAEQVCASDELESDQILDVLLRLVDKSLVIAETQEAEPRYHMLEMIRQFSYEKLLESHELENAHNRHLDYFCRLVEAAEPLWFSADRKPSLERLTLEHDNVRVALRLAAECGSSEIELRLAGALFWFWYHRGYLIDGHRRLEEALSHTSVDVPTAVRAKALLGSGHLAYYSGDLDAARTRLEESVRLWRNIGNHRYLAYTLIWLGIAAGHQGNFNVVRPSLEESIALFRRLEDEWGLAVAILYLGVNEVLGRTEPQDQVHGCSLLEESTNRFRRLGDHWQLGAALFYLGIAAQSDKNMAQLRFEESLAIFEQVGDKWRISVNLDHLANIARTKGDFQRAAVLYTKNLVLLRESGRPQVYVLSNLGYVSLAQGDSEHASAFFVESLQSALQRNKTNMIPTVLAGLAGVACVEGKVERATRLLATVGKLTEIIKESKLEPFEQTIYDGNIATARAQLDQAAFAKVWAEGRAMTMEQAIEFALEESHE